MRAGRLPLLLLCGLAMLGALGCQKKQDVSIAVPQEEIDKRRSEARQKAAPAEKAQAKASDAAASPAPEPAKAAGTVPADAAQPPAADSVAPGQSAEAPQATQPAATSEALAQAWGHRGKDRPSLAKGDTERAKVELSIATGPSYTLKNPKEIDDLRAQEQDGDTPESHLFQIITIRTPFRQITQKPPERGPLPGREPTAEQAQAEAGPQATAQAPGATPPTGEGQKPPAGVGGPLPGPSVVRLPEVPPTGTGFGSVPIVPGQLPPPVIVQERGPRVSPQELARQREEARLNQFYRDRFGSALPGAARPAHESTLNLEVAGTVVGRDGRATAVLKRGTSSVWVSEGGSFVLDGRTLRVVKVTQGSVQVLDGQRKVTLNVGGSSPWAQ